MTPEECTAREGVRDTLARYNLAGDRGRLEEVAGCFTADGVLEIEGEPPLRGRAAVLERLRGAAAELAAGSERALMRHHLTTSHVEWVAPDAARAWSYFLVVTEAGLDHSGRYVDLLAREGEVWRFAHRRVRIDWRARDTRFRRSLGAGDTGTPPRDDAEGRGPSC